MTDGTDLVDVSLATEGVLRYVSPFGPMLVKVKEDRAYVNGQAVQSADFGPLPGGTPPV